jgi:hypothetical protein
MAHAPDLGLAARYALLTTLCALIPVPFLDTWAENRVRRTLVRRIAAGHGKELPDEAVRTVADLPSGGCFGMIKAALWWPVKKLLKTIATVFLVKGLADGASEVMHRALMVHHALEAGLLPDEAERVRAAMDRALEHVDTRWFERLLFGRLRKPRGEYNRMVFEAARDPRGAEQAAATGTMGPLATQLSEEMVAAARTTGLVAEVVHWFVAELDAVPDEADDAEPAGGGDAVGEA